MTGWMRWGLVPTYMKLFAIWLFCKKNMNGTEREVEEEGKSHCSGSIKYHCCCRDRTRPCSFGLSGFALSAAIIGHSRDLTASGLEPREGRTASTGTFWTLPGPALQPPSTSRFHPHLCSSETALFPQRRLISKRDTSTTGKSIRDGELPQQVSMQTFTDTARIL